MNKELELWRLKEILQKYLTVLERKRTLKTMKDIMRNYLNNKITHNQAANRLFYEIDINYIFSLCGLSESELKDFKNVGDSKKEDFIISDCYYAIKQLAEEPRFSTTDVEIQYFYECLNGERIYDLNEKYRIIQEFYNG
ncbi:MAG: hypothetical protein FWG24_06450 [Eggerthellaceae bacterium]|nr:hypothetical protein [Eggerthellaceae bacterium]